MIPASLKELFVPGSLPFLLIAALPGLLLLYRRKDHGRAGKIWITILLFAYWIVSTPAGALALVDALAPAVTPVLSAAGAPGATAIVVLGAGVEVHRSRGDAFRTPTRDGTLRVLEAARLHHLLGVPIVATGGLGSGPDTEAGVMARQLEALGVPAGRIIREERSTNTRDHALFVPPLLAQHGLGRFVLVTSRQHIRRSLGAFRAVGQDPIAATPEVFVPRGRPLEMYLPSRTALYASEQMLYDAAAWVYYKGRGWI